MHSKGAYVPEIVYREENAQRLFLGARPGKLLFFMWNRKIRTKQAAVKSIRQIQCGARVVAKNPVLDKEITDRSF